MWKEGEPAPGTWSTVRHWRMWARAASTAPIRLKIRALRCSAGRWFPFFSSSLRPGTADGPGGGGQGTFGKEPMGEKTAGGSGTKRKGRAGRPPKKGKQQTRWWVVIFPMRFFFWGGGRRALPVELAAGGGEVPVADGALHLLEDEVLVALRVLLSQWMESPNGPQNLTLQQQTALRPKTRQTHCDKQIAGLPGVPTQTLHHTKTFKTQLNQGTAANQLRRDRGPHPGPSHPDGRVGAPGGSR